MHACAAWHMCVECVHSLASDHANVKINKFIPRCGFNIAVWTSLSSRLNVLWITCSFICVYCMVEIYYIEINKYSYQKELFAFIWKLNKLLLLFLIEGKWSYIVYYVFSFSLDCTFWCVWCIALQYVSVRCSPFNDACTHTQLCLMSSYLFIQKFNT